MKKNIIISIDGFSGTGKSSVSKIISKKLNLIHIDSGAMYRAVCLFMLNNNINLKDEKIVSENLKKIDIKIENKNGNNIIFLNKKDVSKNIRSDTINKNVSLVAGYNEVRKFLINQQRKMMKLGSIIMDGRDIGTKVFPDANYKFFFEANIEEKTKRRFKELKEYGSNMSFDQVKKNLLNRDQKDKKNTFSPKDAILIDTTNLTIDEVVDFVIGKIGN